jgi:glycosyltransferase involved in cell wall biosynthesis
MSKRVLFDGQASLRLGAGSYYLFLAYLLGKKLAIYWHETAWHIQGRWPYDNKLGLLPPAWWRNIGFVLRHVPAALAIKSRRTHHFHVCEYGARLLVESMGISGANVSVVNNITRSDNLLKFEVPMAFTPNLLVACGGLRPRKRPDLFLELAKRLKDRGNYRLIWVGAFDAERYSKEHLDRLLEAEGLTGIVSFTGYTDTPERIIAEANVFVHLAEHDPMPKVLMEALALGKPIVSFAVDGIPELLGTHGRLVQFGDIEGFVEQVERSKHEMSEASQRRRREYYESRFSEKNFARQFRRALDRWQ